MAKAVAAALFLSVGVNLFLFQVSDVRQSSMENTLVEGDRVVLSKIDYRLHPPEHGDIIVFRPPPPACAVEASCIPFVKRVIGVPGDVIDVRDGAVWRDGVRLEEPYVTGPTERESGGVDYPLVVPPDRLFVLGDNRPVSGDSRSWGLAETSAVVGKAVLVFWPPRAVRLLGP